MKTYGMALLGALTALLPLTAAANTTGLSDRTMTIVVPYPPGATTDLTARLVAEKLQDDFGQTVIVENRPGASGNVGANYVSKSAPDGHTILMATDATHASNYYLFDPPLFHPIDDSTPITLAASNVIVLVTRADLPVDDLESFIEYARNNPGKLSFGSSGVGSPHHLAGELFNEMAGIDILHVPYKGGAAAVTDLMGGELTAVYSSVVEALPYVNDGQFKVLGVTQADRYPNLPDTPAIGEVLEGFDVSSWLAFTGPANIPADVVERLNEGITKALTSEEITKRLNEVGLMVVASSAEEFEQQQKADFELRGELIESIGLEPAQ